MLNKPQYLFSSATNKNVLLYKPRVLNTRHKNSILKSHVRITWKDMLKKYFMYTKRWWRKEGINKNRWRRERKIKEIDWLGISYSCVPMHGNYIFIIFFFFNYHTYTSPSIIFFPPSFPIINTTFPYIFLYCTVSTYLYIKLRKMTWIASTKNMR